MCFWLAFFVVTKLLDPLTNRRLPRHRFRHGLRQEQIAMASHNVKVLMANRHHSEADARGLESHFATYLLSGVMASARMENLYSRTVKQ